MATDLTPRCDLSTAESSMLVDVQKIESVLVGGCFDALNFLKRAATVIGIALAAKAVAGARPQIELYEDGWRLGPDCTDAPNEVFEHVDRPSIESLIERSYRRDYASQVARVALSTRKREASDKYFAVSEEEDTGEISPALSGFRERNQPLLQLV